MYRRNNTAKWFVLGFFCFVCLFSLKIFIQPTFRGYEQVKRMTVLRNVEALGRLASPWERDIPNPSPSVHRHRTGGSVVNGHTSPQPFFQRSGRGHQTEPIAPGGSVRDSKDPVHGQQVLNVKYYAHSFHWAILGFKFFPSFSVLVIPVSQRNGHGDNVNKVFEQVHADARLICCWFYIALSKILRIDYTQIHVVISIISWMQNTCVTTSTEHRLLL